MKKLIVIIMAGLMLTAFSACSLIPGASSSEVSESINSESSEESSTNEENGEDINWFLNLQKNVYDELKVTIEAVDGPDFSPKEIIEFLVKIENTGDKDIMYPVGSGKNVIPDAVKVVVEGLQPVVPKEHMGPMTMDMQYATLEAGKSMEYKLSFATTKESDDFTTHLYEFFTETEKHVSDDLEGFLGKYTDVEAAEAKTYSATAYVIYAVFEEGKEPTMVEENMSVNTSNEIKINVK